MKTKENEYAMKILHVLGTLFNEDNDVFIDKNDFKDGDNLTDFIHALGNVAPTRMYDLLTGNDTDTLSFNHIANHLVFQYSKQVK